MILDQVETIAPADAQELASALSDADRRGLAVIPQGGGTKSAWGNPPSRADARISTKKLNRVVDHAAGDMTVVVEAGCTITDLQRTLAHQGQRLSCDPLWPEQATVGGILATNDSGAWRLRYGGLRDLVIGITVALPDGTLAMSGGRVVKNVAGYDLPKLMTGALGTLGIITQAVFRLHPVPHASVTITMEFPTARDAQEVLLAIQASQMAHTALQLRLADGEAAYLDMLLEGTQAGIEAQRNQLMALAKVPMYEAGAEVWGDRQRLWPVGGGEAIVKVSLLPSQISDFAGAMSPLCEGNMHIVAQATGLMTARLKGNLERMRSWVEQAGGSFVMLTLVNGIDAWGSPGNALALMRAVKAQFDPKGTLNPGRFVGGI